MAEPEEIVQFLQRFFLSNKDYTGRKILISAGPTYEQIDPVRFIGNNSSGKMGVAIAEELSNRGADVILVLGPSSQPISHKLFKTIRVRSADEMYNACVEHFPACDAAIMSAAVADYTPVDTASEKIKKTGNTLTVELKKTKDILGSLGQMKKNGQVLVGFALETNNGHEYALGKLKSKNADMIVLNSLADAGAGFGTDTNKITIFDKQGNTVDYPLKTKTEVAGDIADALKKIISE
jgi:phosphopantothenoylcysteine decarboxylase/phosphopantothenate--cysteine ligase